MELTMLRMAAHLAYEKKGTILRTAINHNFVQHLQC